MSKLKKIDRALERIEKGSHNFAWRVMPFSIMAIIVLVVLL
ncbi:hypothetical protein SAMN05877838_3794 [Hoeflea halophila]|uniref:Uncharacterized protein n=1 Tax=Hoeflea halophila TaxID=714899 RepID=A0A286IFG9_9HYPH|nr:hypothetical protein [Hoeflea halophila]SOE18850.1 hypothetical protein SAMN05877838_3794 [Hoeflea halophila]